ncbi:MAG: hypothetical protein LBS54_04170 [Dysgonamonadaceae bacterium]|jgi:hypothetical protein|nr:hypothetical protein [Dysgonamonadaceae bacterium]
MNITKGKEQKRNYNESETVVIKRSQIQIAPYNPRKENANVVSELKKNFKRVAFCGGIVWNERTGTLISGHKRLKALDILNGYDGTTEADYDIKVEKVNLDEKTEKEQNVFMNSKTVQGAFDLDLLGAILPEIDYKLAGLDDGDMNLIAAQTSLALKSAPIDLIEKDMADIDKPYEERREAMKELKQNIKESIKDNWQASENYFMVSFDNIDNKAAFLELFGYNPDDKYVKGEELMQKTEMFL